LAYTFKAWQPYEGYQTIAIEDDFEAIMWGLNHQADIFTQDDKLVYSPNDDEEYNLERLAKYGVHCVDDENGRRWERITSDSFKTIENITVTVDKDFPFFMLNFDSLKKD